MSSVQLQSLAVTSGNTGGGYSNTLVGIWSDVVSLGNPVGVNAGLTLGITYVISALGTTSIANWHVLGVPLSTAPLAGVSFTCAATGVTGSGQVEPQSPTAYQVFFDGIAATNVVVENNNEITCVVPARVSGLVNVTVSNLNTGITSTLANCFTYLDPGQTTLESIRLQAQQRADMVNSEFISTTEWNSYINSSYLELYDILVQKFGDDYFVAIPYQYTTAANTQMYALPTDFYKLLGVEIQLNTGMPASWVTLKKFNFIDRNRWSYPNVYTFYGITNLRYRVNGNNLMIVPINQAGQTLQIWYIPRQKMLVNDGDIVDGVSGWEEYIIADACIKAWNKQESDPSIFIAQKAALLKRIEEAAENRDPGQADHVSDTKNLNYGWGNGSDFGGNGNSSGW